MKRATYITLILALTSCHKQTFDERVLSDVENFNKKEAPKRADEVTILDSLQYDVESKTVIYFHTLEGNADNEELLTEYVKKKQYEGLLKNLKGSIQLKPYKEQGLNFEYRYYSKKSGKLIMSYNFTPNVYNSEYQYYQDTFEDSIRLEVRNFNINKAPQVIDDSQTLDSLSYDESTQTITNYYTVRGEADNDSVYSNQIVTLQREGLLQELRKSNELRPYKMHGLIFRYVYRSSKSDKIYMDLSFGPEEYN